jgi:L-threonylcarbamoyladenylate synthase
LGKICSRAFIFAAMMQTSAGTDIALARQYLQDGELVAIPTETVYGLAANALNDEAVIKIFEAKNRPSFNPLIVHCASWQHCLQYVQQVPAIAHELAARFMPGPLTFLLDKQAIIPDLVTAGSSRVAIRVPAHPLTLQLLQQLSFPLAAPSANPFGYISPTTAGHVFNSLQGKIPYILDGGAAAVGLESTIIGFNQQQQVLLYRSGGISAEQIQAVTGQPVLMASDTTESKPATSGRLKSHYAPHTPLYMGNLTELVKQYAHPKMAIISFDKPVQGAVTPYQFVLSPSGNLQEAARNLFAVLRKIDELDAAVIVAAVFPDEGIGRAINDRLSRAVAANKAV